MSGYYHPNQHLPPQYYQIDPNAVPNPSIPNAAPIMAPDGSLSHGIPESPLYHPMPGSFVQYGEPQLQQGFLDQYEDNQPGTGSASGGNGRVRRRAAPGDGVKHRRTRSGCYTCRQRRVKCDENHPICERCRKGNRECVYPEPQSESKGARSSAKSSQKSSTDGSSPEDHEEEDSKDRLPIIFDDDDEEDMEIGSRRTVKHEALREASDTPSLTVDRSPSPGTEASIATQPTSRPPLSRKGSAQATKIAVPTSKISSGIPQDVQFYLNYFRNHMSGHHYSLKTEADHFLKNDFLDMAFKKEPLRYAVAGYAAYFHTISKPDGHMSSFLRFYNESVSRLRESITKNKKQGLSTFCTILQLASIEEMLGDWVNLMGHQKAAHEILTRLYTPQTITQSELLRKVLLWYIRFDLFVGFQSGMEAVLGREWYETIHDYYAAQARADPENLTLKYEESLAHSLLVAKDSGDLFAKAAKKQISNEDFVSHLQKLDARVNNLDKDIDPVLLDPSGYVTDFPRQPDPDDLVNPFEPNVIFGGSRWTSNYLMLNMYGIIFMYHIQVSMALRKPFDPDLVQKAYRACQIFVAVCEYPEAPPGAIIEAQAAYAIASLFLPKDKATTEWCRRNFAKIESSGYIYSSTTRGRILESWGLEASDWWLPNDERCPRIIRSIKDFIRERTTAPKDQTSEDLREMRGIFSTLTISDSPSSSDTTGYTPIEGGVGAPANMDETFIYTGGSPDQEWSSEGRYHTEAYGAAQYPGQ